MMATEGGDFYADDGSATAGDDGYLPALQTYSLNHQTGLDVDITTLTEADDLLLSNVFAADGNNMFDTSNFVVLSEEGEFEQGIESLVLSTQYTGATPLEGELLDGESGTLESSEIEWFTGLENGSLSTNLGGTKNSIDATTGSATSISGVGAVGDTFSFNFIFDSGDYNPFEDFAYVSVNDKVNVLTDLNTGKTAAVKSNVIGEDNIGSVVVDGETTTLNYDGYFEYSLQASDFGGANYGDFTLSVGVMNALDNAVETKLYLTNMDYSPAEYLSEGEDGTIDGDYLDDEYADDYSGTFETIGNVYVEEDVWGGFSLSTAGNVVQANIGQNKNQDSLESFAGLSKKTLDLAMQIDDGTSFSGSSVKKKINATEGSAVTLTASATAGDIASFYYFFETNDYTPYADFSYYSVGEKAYMIAGVGTNVGNYGVKEGIVDYEIKAGDIDENGQFSMTVGIVDALDGAVESVIDVWGFDIKGEGETGQEYEAPDGYEEDDYGDFDGVIDGDDTYSDEFEFDYGITAGTYLDIIADGFIV